MGVVTVTYNSAAVLNDFLDSVWKQTYRDFFLYVVDSGSTDDTAAKLAEISDSRVRAVVSETNIGFAAGCNVGMKMALQEGCDTIMLLNNDTVFKADMFQSLRDGLEMHGCEMTTPKMLYYDPPNKIWAAGGHLNKWLGYRNAHDGANQLDDGRFDTARRVTFTPFCCVLMRSSVIERIGYLDENYFVYTEDADYCFRAMKAGLSLWYVPQAKLRHKVSSLTGGEETPFLVRYCTRNRVYFLRKNLRPAAAGPWMAGYIAYYLARWLTGRDTKSAWTDKRQAMKEGFRMGL